MSEYYEKNGKTYKRYEKTGNDLLVTIMFMSEFQNFCKEHNIQIIDHSEETKPPQPDIELKFNNSTVCWIELERQNGEEFLPDYFARKGEYCPKDHPSFILTYCDSSRKSRLTNVNKIDWSKTRRHGELPDDFCSVIEPKYEKINKLHDFKEYLLSLLTIPETCVIIDSTEETK